MSICQWLARHLGVWVDTRRVDPEMEDVRDFQRQFNHLHNDHPVHLTRRKLYERLDCMHEELDEFKLAIEDQDLAGQADALIDLVYFAKGTASMLGLPWEELWDDVHDANMAKVPGIGKRGHKVDCIKPPGWVPPRTHEILEKNGYKFVMNPDEELCHDDE